MVPFSKLFSDTKERVQCAVSTLAMVAAGCGVYFGLGGDWRKIGALSVCRLFLSVCLCVLSACEGAPYVRMYRVSACVRECER